MAAGELSKAVAHLRGILTAQDAARMTDTDLLHLYVQERDETAFEALLRRHGPMVLGVCRRVLYNLSDIEDAFQATFLVLVQKAPSLRSPGQLGGWLHGVAHRTALEARKAAARRRLHEEKAPLRTVEPEDGRTDLRSVLDEELARLPDRYRGVVVTCDLEGKTRTEAARELGLPEGTVASRLTRARNLLRKRLARKGLAVTSGTLAALFAGEAAPACPATLTATTLEAAHLLAARKAVAGVISARAIGLMEGVLKAMFLARIKVAAVVLLAAAVLTAVSGGVLIRGAAPPLDRKPEADTPAGELAKGSKGAKEPPKRAPQQPNGQAEKEKVAWKKVTSRQGQFQVQLPETPGDQGEEPFIGSGFGTPLKYGTVVETRTDLTHFGQGVRLNYSSLLRSGGRISYLAQCWLLPPQMAGKASEDLFKWRRDEEVKIAAGKLLTDDALEVEGGKGRAFLYQWFAGSKEAMRVTDPRSPRFTRTRLIFDGQRLYELSVSGPRKAVTGSDADKFFASFRRTKK